MIKKLIVPMLLLLAVVTASPGMCGDVAEVVAVEHVLDSYHHFLAERGGDPLAISDFSSHWCSRSVVDIVLLQQALSFGGFKGRVQFYAVPNPARAISDVRHGLAVMYSSDIWETDFDETVYKSAPMVRKGEFVLGVYGLDKNKELQNVRSLDELLLFRPVVSQSWTEDIKVLRRMGFKNIHMVPVALLVFRNITKGRGNFTLHSFSPNNNRHTRMGGYRLTRVEGIKVVFPNSRHFMISQKHELGASVHKALDKGVAILRTKGVISKAYRECGLINDVYTDWRNIYPQ